MNLLTKESNVKSVLNFFIIVVSSIFLISCSSVDVEDYEEKGVETIYNAAMDHLLAGKYEDAATLFDEVERQHPYSEWATRAQIMAGYAYYEGQKYDDAITALETFIQLHPSHPLTAYAYYLQGLCYYEQIPQTKRDQEVTAHAMKAFNEVVRRFPDSKYARDAQLKIDLIKDHLAGKEMEVGRFYLKRKSYLAAVNRFRVVVENFETTDQVPEALHRLVEAYLGLGLQQEARKVAAVLGHNYPENAWYAESYYLLEGVDLRPEEYKDDKKGWVDMSWLKNIWPSSKKE